MSKPKIGFLGAGYIAGVHASILARDDRVEVAAVYDIKKLQAAQLAQSVGASVAHSVAEVLATCDVVYIATPNTQHTELAILAAEERKHVFCEKPMATAITDARRLLKAVERNDRVFQVGHNRRFAPVYAELKRMLTERESPAAFCARENESRRAAQSEMGRRSENHRRLFVRDNDSHVRHAAILVWRSEKPASDRFKA